jgi:hypothetical protein
MVYRALGRLVLAYYVVLFLTTNVSYNFLRSTFQFSLTNNLSAYTFKTYRTLSYNLNRPNNSKFNLVVCFDLDYECYNFVF